MIERGGSICAVQNTSGKLMGNRQVYNLVALWLQHGHFLETILKEIHK